MESRLVIEFENTIGLNALIAIDLIKSFFNKSFSEYELLEEYNVTSGHWGIKYKYLDLEVAIQSDYGSLDVFIYFQKREIPFHMIDQVMKNVVIGSEKNITYTLDSLRKHLIFYKFIMAS